MLDRSLDKEELLKQLEALQNKCSFLEKVVQEVPANIYISDLQEGVVWCNQTNEQSLGYSLEEIKAMGIMEYMRKIVHPEDLNIPEDSLAHYQEYAGAEYGGMFRAKHKEQETYKWFMGWAKAFSYQEDGQVKSIVCVDVDMSPSMNTEKQIIKALQENLAKKNQLLIKSLSKREREILSLVCQGMSSKVIAEHLFISVHTVNTHRRNIQNNLGTANVADMVVLAKEAGLG